MNSPTGILDKIKKEIGNTKFNQLMAYDGGVTLAFALDTTGSMYDDIKQAKEIVQGIVMYERTFLVDYVLSPFNDPITHSEYTFFSEEALLLLVDQNNGPRAGCGFRDLLIRPADTFSLTENIMEVFSYPA